MTNSRSIPSCRRRTLPTIIIGLMMLLVLWTEYNVMMVRARQCSWKEMPTCRTPRKGYRPKTNGCGPQQAQAVSQIANTWAPEFITCCNKHDTCYGTCGINKSACDVQFRDCMVGKCLLDIGCRLKAYAFFRAVSEPTDASCKSYVNGQKAGCDCSQSTTTKPIEEKKSSWKIGALKIQ